MGRTVRLNGYEWDEDKSDKNVEDRGFDFAFATEVFDDVFLLDGNGYEKDGEQRLSVIGVVDELHFFVAWTPREGYLRLVSARRAKEKEREQYREHRAKRDDQSA